jgi:hypothetical protein
VRLSVPAGSNNDSDGGWIGGDLNQGKNCLQQSYKLTCLHSSHSFKNQIHFLMTIFLFSR